MLYARDYRKSAWSKLSGNWGTVVVSYLLVSLITSLASTLTFGVGGILVQGPLLVGFAALLILISRGNKAEATEIFSGFKNFGTTLVAGILVPIFTALWTLLFFIPGIVKSYSYSMTYYILNDNPDMTASEAITESRRIMDGNKWRLFCLDFSFIGWMILSVFTFGILIFWVAPYMQMARAEFYESIKSAQKKANA